MRKINRKQEEKERTNKKQSERERVRRGRAERARWKGRRNRTEKKESKQASKKERKKERKKEKKYHVAHHFFLRLYRMTNCMVLIKQFIQAQQGRGGIAAAAAQTGGERDFLFQVDADAVADIRRAEKCGSGALDKIASVRRQTGFAASKLNSSRGAGESEVVAEVDRMENRFEGVEAVGPPAEDVQQQVNLAGRFFFKRHRTGLLAGKASKGDKRKRANRGWRV